MSYDNENDPTTSMLKGLSDGVYGLTDVTKVNDIWYLAGQSMTSGDKSIYCGCFPGWTPISTPIGTVEIATLKPGDTVLSWNQDNSELTERRVKKRVKYSPKRIWEVYYDGSSTPLSVTQSHSIMTLNGWKKVSSLKTLEDAILMIDNASKPSWVNISSVTRTDEVLPVYNLITEYEHNYIAGNILAHNFTHFRLLRSIYHGFIESITSSWIHPRSIHSKC